MRRLSFAAAVLVVPGGFIVLCALGLAWLLARTQRGRVWVERCRRRVPAWMIPPAFARPPRVEHRAA